jgi:hypothetical protein
VKNFLRGRGQGEAFPLGTCGIESFQNENLIEVFRFNITAPFVPEKPAS